MFGLGRRYFSQMASFSPGLGRQEGVPAGAPPIPAPGVLLVGRYRLDERVGQGGMAEVWRAHDEQLDRDVAIKLLHRHLLPDERSRERFAAEARAVAGLSHPGIVTVHDIVVDDGLAGIVLELVDGETLNDVIAREGRIAEAGAAAITAQVAHALQAAHDRGLVHRDVKPANVLLSPDGRARLVDFGIARALDDRESNLTLPGTIMGTLRYMAPEQLADGAADRATDVFGLGSLLYEMLVGRPPFPAATPAALMAQQRQGAPPVHRVSPELANLARTALNHDPERRPRTPGLMAALLERWLDNRGISSADLPAVVVAALQGGALPRPAPVVAPRPAITPAPILEPAAAPPVVTASPAPKKRRSRNAPTDQLALGDPAALPIPGAPGIGAMSAATAAAATGAAASASGSEDPSRPAPMGSSAQIAAIGAAAASGASEGLSPGGLPGLPRAGDSLMLAEPWVPAVDDSPASIAGSAPPAPASSVESSAVTAVRTGVRAPLRFAGRRVPLITAVGLAGLLLAGLLLAGALTALQAGTSRPLASATPSHGASAVPTEPAAAATTAPTARPVVAPTKAAPAKPDKPGKPRDDKPPRRRDN
jgi:serine/threonine-protein kinase